MCEYLQHQGLAAAIDHGLHRPPRVCGTPTTPEFDDRYLIENLPNLLLIEGLLKSHPQILYQQLPVLVSCPKFLGLSVMLHLRRGECYGQEKWIVG